MQPSDESDVWDEVTVDSRFGAGRSISHSATSLEFDKNFFTSCSHRPGCTNKRASVSFGHLDRQQNQSSPWPQNFFYPRDPDPYVGFNMM